MTYSLVILLNRSMLTSIAYFSCHLCVLGCYIYKSLSLCHRCFFVSVQKETGVLFVVLQLRSDPF